MYSYKLSQWAGHPAYLENAAGNPLFKEVELNWRKPTLWGKSQRVPDFEHDKAFLYILLRDHGNSRQRDQIVYVGLTASPLTRFGDHKKAKQVVKQHGTVRFTYAPIDFVQGRNRVERLKRALEELEHLIIWAVPDRYLRNEKKMFTLPGMGSNGGNAWHVRNTGYRFSGQMPREIVYPWMMIAPGRNRSLKA